MQLTSSYICLLLALVLGLFIRHRNLLYICIAISCIVAVWENIVNLSGVLTLGLLALTSWLYFNKHNLNNLGKLFLFAVLIGLLAALVSHHAPGFNNPLIIDKLVIGHAQRHFSSYLNFDKVLAALIIFSTSPLIFNEKALTLVDFKKIAKILASCIIVIIIPAVLINYVRLDLKIPTILPLWAVHNLLFVSFSDEVIFRGFLQKNLKLYVPAALQRPWLILLLSSIVFGFAHYRNGMIYMSLATICGLFYGYAYQKTQRIWGAMLVHFGFNLAHFLCFTYPY